ncbi:MAG: DNA polymerase III subunit gamma/tau [Candidatus Gracilibacteria bacterium]|nr:DNA polymerase III subunit gamma/tau [Candidatus Gracilibacteria bacterium]
MTLYLKYRPKDFDNLVGQDFIKSTLKQAIIKDKLVGAYLFCGPRGTGKTSTARLFAKSINCTDLQNGNPCLKCDICIGFDNENLVDIIEIDAASHTGVDNIREIIERAQFSPTKCRFKVYIIDEVHMLSKGAFNALLKILEEPPTHLKFILATTESHKIPETILSRCQRYDFKSINDVDLKNRLEFIAKSEGIKVDEKSFEFILKQSAGGARNAISLFEQLIYNDEINYDNVINTFGIPKTEILQNFYQKLISKDTSLINDFDEIANNYNLGLFFKELLFLISNKMLEVIDDKNNLEIHINILQNIEKSYINSKNTFDPKTTYLVGILKSLKDIKEENIQVLSNISQKTSFTQTPKQTIQSPKVEEKIITDEPFEDELSPDDLFDVFGDNEMNITTKNTQIEENISIKPVENIPILKQNSNSGFDKESLISKLKDLKAKGALTMSLRGADLFMQNNKLIIVAKTSFGAKQIDTQDNIAIINEGLSNMGITDIDIEIKIG